MKYRFKYIYTDFGYPKHDYTLIGRHGGIQFHVTDFGVRNDCLPRYSAGLEFHRRVPAEWQEDHAPSQDHCWLLKQPCWHDGTSLYAEENLLPLWKLWKNEHDKMKEVLIGEYEVHFHVKTEVSEALRSDGNDASHQAEAAAAIASDKG